MLAGINLNLGGTHYAILDQGAHALAWQPPGAREVLWCSRLARFEPGVPVRGGVPVIFPWFGSGVDGARRPAHGYARTGMSAFVEMQEAEFAAAEKGFTAVKHQREVGTGYFDAVTTTVQGSQSSTTALKHSTEDEQFFDKKAANA